VVAHVGNELSGGSGDGADISYNYFHNLFLQFVFSTRPSIEGGVGVGLHLFFGVNVIRGTIISSIEMPPCWKVSR
jgi:hypothetical protein